MTLNGNGIRIPSWAVGAIVAFVAVTSVVWNVFDLRQDDLDRVTSDRRRIERLEERYGEINFRLCRIEAANRVSPYATCERRGNELQTSGAP